MKPLNTQLYSLLKRRFGEVRISNPGERFVGYYVAPRAGDHMKLEIAHPGEHYLVCCPRCNDTRFRLQFHHLWGWPDPDARGDRKMQLVYCFNENCFDDIGKKYDLFYKVYEVGAVTRKRGRIRRGRLVPVEKRSIDLPGPITPLQRLPRTHPAIEYLEGRFFDPDKIGRVYGVGYCATSHYYLAGHRIIIPVLDESGTMRGWQARFIGEPPKGGVPKYFTAPNMQRRSLLYNINRAKEYCTVVVVEGPTDVWSVGPMAVAAFGKTLTQMQRVMLRRHWRQGSCVLLFDANAQEENNEMHLKLRNSFRHGCAAVPLPDGTDPGSLDRGFLRGLIADQATSQGVKVWFEKWA